MTARQAATVNRYVKAIAPELRRYAWDFAAYLCGETPKPEAVAGRAIACLSVRDSLRTRLGLYGPGAF